MQALFDFLRWVIENGFKFWFTLQPWEMGLRVRSVPRKVQKRQSFGPGIHWKLPFVDHFEVSNVASQVSNLPNQSVRTADGKTLAISGAVTYSIHNIEKYHVNVQNADTSIQTLTMALLTEYVARNSLVQCSYDAIVAAVLPKLRKAGFTWGIEVEAVSLTDLCEHRALRLMMMDAPQSANVPQHFFN